MNEEHNFTEQDISHTVIHNSLNNREPAGDSNRNISSKDDMMDITNGVVNNLYFYGDIQASRILKNEFDTKSVIDVFGEGRIKKESPISFWRHMGFFVRGISFSKIFFVFKIFSLFIRRSNERKRISEESVKEHMLDLSVVQENRQENDTPEETATEVKQGSNIGKDVQNEGMPNKDGTIFSRHALDDYQEQYIKHTLYVQELHKYFGRKKAVQGVSFSVNTGEVVGFLGPNGAGKTTVFYMIVGFIIPTKGTIVLDGEVINNFPMHKRAKLGISYLPQEASVFRRMTVENNILAILETIPKLTREERMARLESIMGDFGLLPLRKQKAYTLSGGERRRTEIARAMALKPRFLLLDEPFTGIDPKARYELKQIIAALTKRGVGVLITDHNEHDTLSITNRAFIIHNGQIMVTGSREEIMNDVQAREIYLGEHYGT